MCPCPMGTNSYIIKPGDTFYSLAIRFGTSITAIISANSLVDPRRMRVGQEICIPTQGIFPACPEENYYRIRFGDTLNSIAEFFNVSVDDLIEANPGIDQFNLSTGQVICIPLATPPVQCPPTAERYIIKAGDTFYSLSQRLDISIQAIQEANPGITPEALLIGQPICIPLKTVEARLYYGNLDNSELVYTVKTIPYTNEEEIYLNTLIALIKGPYDENMNTTINKNTKVLSLEIEDGIATVDLSNDFISFAGTLDEVIAVRSLVQTLIQFEVINGVRILIEGEDLIGPSGMPYGILR